MRRRWSTLAVIGAILPAVLSLPGTASAGSPQVVAACDQNVGVGHFACFAERLVTPAPSTGTGRASAAPSGFGPADLSSAYGLGSAPSGAGRRIYVVDAFGDPNAAADLAVYRSRYHLPACTVANGCFQKLNEHGKASPLPALDQGWAVETSVDLDTVSAACPSCAITLIESTDSGDSLMVAAHEAIVLGAKYVSLSWGAPDDGSDAASDAKYLTPNGVFYAVATGDSGFTGGASYPSTSPYVVAVGGTSLSRDASTSRGWAETAWSDASSGCSTNEAQPARQVPLNTSCAGRAVADVSAVADPATGVAVYDSTDAGWEVIGGTSAAAPLIAGIAARAGAATGSPSAYPYAHAGTFNDVTSGSNSGLCLGNVQCQAGPGWDGPTGLGTPRGIASFGSGGGASQVTSCTGNRVSNPGFEAGPAGWSVASSRIQHTRTLAHTGSSYALLDSTGHRHTDRLARTVTIPRGCSATLSYYLRVTSTDHSRTAHDTLTLTVNGTVRQVRSNLARGAHYTRITLNLARYAGKRITLAWTGRENARLATGFYLDDIRVTLGR